MIRVGGRGNLIDDGGSGFWIAREALRAVLRSEEEKPGAGWTTTLGLPRRALGGTDWNIVRSFVYGGDRGKIGSLARAVGEAAQENDKTALRILRKAGKELARLANALIKRLGPRPVALVGGSARLHPLLSDAFRRSWWPRRVHRHRSRRRADGGTAGRHAQQDVTDPQRLTYFPSLRFVLPGMPPATSWPSRT